MLLSSNKDPGSMSRNTRTQAGENNYGVQTKVLGNPARKEDGESRATPPLTIPQRSDGRRRLHGEQGSRLELAEQYEAEE
ncbi:hypothetical protein PAHAL_6G258100 [Panicum hallii]|jgi:hypothetical protein|uniref:Uncharacterized protein n=1 Tax=Panicum hallii TaxID=206008 RepID=A0A2T8IHJ4_9POAL|nr:hypothetical protein PAHAL_6G258100 [Panicum hallii]